MSKREKMADTDSTRTAVTRTSTDSYTSALAPGWLSGAEESLSVATSANVVLMFGISSGAGNAPQFVASANEPSVSWVRPWNSSTIPVTSTQSPTAGGVTAPPSWRTKTLSPAYSG